MGTSCRRIGVMRTNLALRQWADIFEKSLYFEISGKYNQNG
jgi:hypothetical protein